MKKFNCQAVKLFDHHCYCYTKIKSFYELVEKNYMFFRRKEKLYFVPPSVHTFALVMTKVNTDSWQHEFMVLTLACVGMINAFNGVFQVGYVYLLHFLKSSAISQFPNLTRRLWFLIIAKLVEIICKIYIIPKYTCLNYY